MARAEIAVFVLALLASATAVSVNFFGVFSPVTGAPAYTGAAYVNLNTATGKLTVTVASNVPNIVYCHIHYSGSGPYSGLPIYNMSIQAGGCNPVSTFTVDTNTNVANGGAATNFSDIAELLAGNYYVNIHTATYTSGIVAAKLYLGTPVGYAPFYDGYLNVVSGATASGAGSAAVWIAGQYLFVAVAQNLVNQVNACHVHYSPTGPSGSGVPIYNMTNPDGSCAQVSVFTLNSNQDLSKPTLPALGLTDVTELQLGNYYVNVHTVNYTNGEVRANLGTYLPFYGELSPVFNVTTTAVGSAVALVNGPNLYVALAQNVSQVTACHVHYSPTGAAPPGIGSPIYNLTNPNGGGCFPLSNFSLNTNQYLDQPNTPAANLTDIANLLAGKYYVNVHSTTYSGGEISTFILQASAAPAALFTGILYPPNSNETTSGRGAATVYVSGNNLIVSVAYTGFAATVCHIHYSPTGAAGSGVPIYNMSYPTGGCAPTSIFVLNSNQDLTNSSLPALNLTDLTELQNGNYYVNIHSVAYSEGEVRANLVYGQLPAPTAPANTVAPTSGPTSTTGPTARTTPTPSTGAAASVVASFMAIVLASLVAVFLL